MSDKPKNQLQQVKAAWDSAAGVVEEHEEEANYLREMVFSGASRNGLLLSIIAGGVLSIPMGLGFAAVPIIAFLGAQAIAALFVPSSPVFRHYIDRKRNRERRGRVREQLLKSIGEYDPLKSRAGTAWVRSFADYQERYQRMNERLQNLRKVAKDRKSSLSESDLDKLDEATVDFLRLVRARMVLIDRMDAARSSDVDDQLKRVESELERSQSAVDRKRLERAKEDLERVVLRTNRLPAKDAATAAQLTTMSEAFEEVYHRIVTDPAGADVADYLREATERLSIEEELSLSVDEEMESLTRRSRAKQAVAKRQKA